MEEVCWLKYEWVQKIKRMNEISRKVLKHYQIRKTRKQKEEFRKFLVDELKQYGCMDYVKEYDEVVSYFTIGPSIGKEEEVTHLVKQISMDKLLMESDGIEAVKWAIDSDNYIAALKNEIAMVASLKNQSYSEVERILDQNFSKLIKK